MAIEKVIDVTPNYGKCLACVMVIILIFKLSQINFMLTRQLVTFVKGLFAML